MMTTPAAERITPRLIDALHMDALLLADEARAYFDDLGRDERDQLPPVGRVAFACESLKITTRLMHVIAWLISRRGGDAPERAGMKPLGRAPETEPAALAVMPATARQLIEASLDLHGRVERLDRDLRAEHVPASPALALIGRLERAF